MNKTPQIPTNIHRYRTNTVQIPQQQTTDDAPFQERSNTHIFFSYIPQIPTPTTTDTLFQQKFSIITRKTTNITNIVQKFSVFSGENAFLFYPTNEIKIKNGALFAEKAHRN